MRTKSFTRHRIFAGWLFITCLLTFITFVSVPILAQSVLYERGGSNAVSYKLYAICYGSCGTIYDYRRGSLGLTDSSFALVGSNLNQTFRAFDDGRTAYRYDDGEVIVNVTRSTKQAYIEITKRPWGVEYYARTANAKSFGGGLHLDFSITIVGSKSAKEPTLGAAVGYDEKIYVSWLNNTNLGTKIQIQKGTAEVQWGQIAAVASVPSIFRDESVEPNKKYFYRVRACNDANACTPFTKEVEAINRKIFFVASAANRREGPVAVESEVIAAGADLAKSSRSVAVPLPELEETKVFIKDAAGITRQALIRAVSPTEVKFIVPSITLGDASIQVQNWRGDISRGQMKIAATNPGLYAADEALAGGPANGQLLRILPGGLIRRYEALTKRDEDGNVVPVPIEYLSDKEQLFLYLSGSGFRFRSSLSGVTARIGSTYPQTLFAGPSEIPGQDVLVLRLPKDLPEKTDLEIAVTIDGNPANLVTIRMK